ncbi:MAG: helix-turn-helix domain-containing protein [Armatimonadota bacterium]|nr:helix-turn-helix domain-containing protein [Armatimonadota bacterium]
MARDARQRFGDAVRALRREAGLTQEQLADKTGLHVTYIAGIETGRRNPSLRSILALADGLGVAASELLRRMEGAA